MFADPAGRGPRPPRPGEARPGGGGGGGHGRGPGPGARGPRRPALRLYEVPPWVMCRFYKVMDALERRLVPVRWVAAGRQGGRGRGAARDPDAPRPGPLPRSRPDRPRPDRAAAVRRSGQRHGQRPGARPWINRNARVADLVRILTHLQLLRARDIITACGAAPETPGTPGPWDRGRPGCLGLTPSSLGLTSFPGLPGHPPAASARQHHLPDTQHLHTL